MQKIKDSNVALKSFTDKSHLRYFNIITSIYFFSLTQAA